eukprot:5843912-Ditylum_brightwellii.AAC.1
MDREAHDKEKDVDLLNNVIKMGDGSSIKSKKADFKDIAKFSMIKNCPVTVEDIENANNLLE